MIFDNKPLLHDATESLSENERLMIEYWTTRLVTLPLATFLTKRQGVTRNLELYGTAKSLLTARVTAHLALQQAHNNADRITIGAMLLQDIGAALKIGGQPQLAAPESPAAQLRAYAQQVWRAGQTYRTKNGRPDTQMQPNLAALADFFKLAPDTAAPAPTGAPAATAVAPLTTQPERPTPEQLARTLAETRAGGVYLGPFFGTDPD